MAVLLEVLPGLCGIFGLGHIYAGQVTVGVILLVGSFTIFPVIGSVLAAWTGGLALCLFYPAVVVGLIVSPILAARACHNPA